MHERAHLRERIVPLHLHPRTQRVSALRIAGPASDLSPSVSSSMPSRNTPSPPRNAKTMVAPSLARYTLARETSSASSRALAISMGTDSWIRCTPSGTPSEKAGCWPSNCDGSATTGRPIDRA